MTLEQLIANFLNEITPVYKLLDHYVTEYS